MMVNILVLRLRKKQVLKLLNCFFLTIDILPCTNGDGASEIFFLKVFM